MSCKIKGRIVSVLKKSGAGKDDVCLKHPCRASVQILEVSDCGSSVSLHVNKKDITEIQFAYTLDNTTKIFPGMKSHFPGLKKGDTFSAFAEQRLKMGTEGVFVVYAYDKIQVPEFRKKLLFSKRHQSKH
jgi:hypothetical protein